MPLKERRVTPPTTREDSEGARRLTAERSAIALPMRPHDFELAKGLVTAHDAEHVYLSDFMVLHMLRQGKMSLEGLRLLRTQFELIDRDGGASVACATGRTEAITYFPHLAHLGWARPS